ncbi:hypothetical protein ACFC63_18200, partial [Streptomyces albidoflavus]
LHTVMTFHQKVQEAAAFANKLPETAAQLYLNDASAAGGQGAVVPLGDPDRRHGSAGEPPSSVSQPRTERRRGAVG